MWSGSRSQDGAPMGPDRMPIGRADARALWTHCPRSARVVAARSGRALASPHGTHHEMEAMRQNLLLSLIQAGVADEWFGRL